MANRIARLTSNPLYLRETRRTTKITARSVLKYSFGLSFIITVFAGVGVIVGDSKGDHIRLMLVLFFLIVVSIPAFVAYAAAIHTISDRQNQQFDLVSITTISNARLIEGYILSVFYRARGFLALIMGFVPAVIIWSVYLSVYDCAITPYETIASCEWQLPTSLFPLLASFIILTLNIGGICLLANVLGVFLGAWWGNRLFSSLVALLIILVTMSIMYMPSTYRISEVLERNQLSIPFIYIACALFALLARPFARKMD